jgi:hypothetical protein
LRQTFKHDFFAATGLYESPDNRLALVKFGRRSEFAGLPLAWIGRWLTQREARFYRQAEDLPGVPKLLGVIDRHVLVREFVPGRPLGRRDTVADDFFPQLRVLLSALHERSIAYVDLNKRQNILLGADGQPYLFDFQISVALPPVGLAKYPPLQWLLRRFQRADDYHYLKHKRRLRPDQLTPEELAAVNRLSIWIRLHRLIARPLTLVRRRMLMWLNRSDDVPVAGSSEK